MFRTQRVQEVLEMCTDVPEPCPSQSPSPLRVLSACSMVNSIRIAMGTA